MTKRLKILTSAFFIAALFAVTKPALASEGTAELTSPTSSARCFVSSVYLENRRYKVSVACRDLIYPPAENLFSYVLWATPVEGGNAVKLGELGVGKADLSTNQAFSELFVTTELNDRVRSPSERVIMRGSIEPISILEQEPQEPQIPEEPAEEAETFGDIIEEPTPTPTPQPASTGFLGRIGRAGIIGIIGIFIVILIIAAITRSRS